MTNKTTKRSLLASSISLLLCFAMLLGTTFAWFTDSATSAGNRIQAGKLDVKLLMWDGSNYVDISDETGDIFAEADKAHDSNKTLWEPGKTQVVYLAIENAGNLDLKYNVDIKAYTDDANTVNKIDMTPAMRYAITPDAQNGTGVTAWDSANAQTVALGMNKTQSEDVKLVKGQKHYFALSVHMLEDAGNEYQNASVLFDLIVSATQLNSENDSFGPDYDIDAENATIVSNADELNSALAAGENVSLGSDLKDVPVDNRAPYGNSYGIALNGGVFDGNGKSIGFDAPSGDNYGIMTSGGTIKNVTIGGVFRGIVIMDPTEDVIIDNVDVGDEDVCYSINTAEGNGQHNLIVKNSTIRGWSSYGKAIKSVSFSNCIFAQGEYYTNVYGRLVKPYVNAVFDSCEFNNKFYIDLSALMDGQKVILKNCTVNGVKLTAENWKSLIVSEDECGDGQISVEGKNDTYMTADNIFDYVIIE